MKKILLSLLTFATFNCFAHDYSGILPADVSTVDHLSVSCSIDGNMIPDKMYFKISTPDSLPLISAQVAKDNIVTNVTPSRGGIEIRQGAGDYRITIDKNGTGVMSYSIEYHCESGGDHTETTIVRY